MKYIAIKTRGSVDGRHVGFQDLSLLDDAGNNLFVGATASASSSYDTDGLMPQKGIDGDINTWWTNGGGVNSRFVVELQNEFYGNIAKLVMLASGSDGVLSPTAFDVQVSSTGNISNDAEWVTLFSFENVSWTYGETKEFIVTHTFSNNSLTNKSIFIRFDGDAKPVSASGLKLFDIDDNEIVVSAISSSEVLGANNNPSVLVSNSGNYQSNTKSVIFKVDVPSNAGDVNYLKFASISPTNPIKKVSIVTDKTGVGDIKVMANFVALRSTTSIAVDKLTGVAIARLGLTKTAAAEKVKIDAIKLKIKLGNPATMTDILSVLMTTTAEGESAAALLSNGGGYDDLRTVGLTDTEALIALGVTNIQVDTDRYESEQGLKAVTTSIPALMSFISYLQPKGKTLSDFSNLAAKLRSVEFYGELRTWHHQYVPA